LFNASFLPYTVSQDVTGALDDRYTKSYINTNFATINGSPAELFDVAEGLSGTNAVNFNQLDTKEDKSVVATKADKSNVLELNNSTAYTPLFDYNPSTKKYVSDSITTAFQLGQTGVFISQDNKQITVTNGLITGIL